MRRTIQLTFNVINIFLSSILNVVYFSFQGPNIITVKDDILEQDIVPLRRRIVIKRIKLCFNDEPNVKQGNFRYIFYMFQICFHFCNNIGARTVIIFLLSRRSVSLSVVGL